MSNGGVRGPASQAFLAAVDLHQSLKPSATVPVAAPIRIVVPATSETHTPFPRDSLEVFAFQQVILAVLVFA